MEIKFIFAEPKGFGGEENMFPKGNGLETKDIFWISIFACD
jgi:hypothetical protein